MHSFQCFNNLKISLSAFAPGEQSNNVYPRGLFYRVSQGMTIQWPRGEKTGTSGQFKSRNQEDFLQDYSELFGLSENSETTGEKVGKQL